MSPQLDAFHNRSSNALLSMFAAFLVLMSLVATVYTIVIAAACKGMASTTSPQKFNEKVWLAVTITSAALSTFFGVLHFYKKWTPLI